MGANRDGELALKASGGELQRVASGGLVGCGEGLRGTRAGGLHVEREGAGHDCRMRADHHTRSFKPQANTMSRLKYGAVKGLHVSQQRNFSRLHAAISVACQRDN